MSSLIPRRSFFELNKIFGDNDWFLPVFSKNEFANPAMDLYETDKEIVVELSVPGFSTDNVDISVEDGILRVSGKAKEQIKDSRRGYLHKEIHFDSFERAISLPAPVRANNIQATYNKGIIKIIMPKEVSKSVAKIKIKSEGN